MNFPLNPAGDIRQMSHLRYTGTDSDIGVRKLTAFNAAQHVSHMIIKSFAFSFLERNGFHAGYVIGYDRYNFPTGPVEYHRAILSIER